MPVMRLWRRMLRSNYASGPSPIDASSVHAPGTDSDRVLVVGSGIAVGWGVLSQDMALAGHLARALSARTGRGTDVDVVVDPSLTARNTPPHLASIVLERYDAVVVVLGTIEAFEFAPVGSWRGELGALLNQLLAAVSIDVVVTGVPSLEALDTFATRLGRVAARHARRYNQATAELCAGKSRSTYVELSPALGGSDGASHAVENYRTWAREIADATAPLLNVSRALGTCVLHDAAKSEAERANSVCRLGILHTAPEARFDRIVDQARMLFNASAAALAFIDGDTLWFKSAIGATLPSIPFKDSFTQATLSERGAFLIPDARADPRFRDLAHVAGEPWVRFWAGFPIEDQDGVRVGTLSVFDSEPRVVTPDYHPAVLRQFALMVQHELRQTSPISAVRTTHPRAHFSHPTAKRLNVTDPPTSADG